MIPKTIHYCWFGKGKKPRSAKRCIKSWKKYFQDYQLIEWNEENYDIIKAPLYVQQAYQMRKWAFVSDYVRFDVLYKYGGIYFDTDVEVIRPFEDIIKNGPFMACEFDGKYSSISECPKGVNNYSETKIRVAPGLVLGAEKGQSIYRLVLDTYANDSFIMEDGSISSTTIVKRVTSLLLNLGLSDVNTIQRIEGLAIYPKEYFCPLNWKTRELSKTENTRTIHWYDASWWEIEKRNAFERAQKERKKKQLKARVRRIIKKIIGKA